MVATEGEDSSSRTNSLSESAEKIDVCRRSKLLRVLKAKKNTELSRSFHAGEICRAIDPHQMLIVIRDERIPRGKESQRTVVGIRPAQADCGMYDINA